jgi:hypothetical protein
VIETAGDCNMAMNIDKLFDTEITKTSLPDLMRMVSTRYEMVFAKGKKALKYIPISKEMVGKKGDVRCYLLLTERVNGEWTIGSLSLQPSEVHLRDRYWYRVREVLQELQVVRYALAMEAKTLAIPRREIVIISGQDQLQYLVAERDVIRPRFRKPYLGELYQSAERLTL